MPQRGSPAAHSSQWFAIRRSDRESERDVRSGLGDAAAGATTGAILHVVVRGTVEITIRSRRYELWRGCAAFVPAGSRVRPSFGSDAEGLEVEIPSGILSLEEPVVEATSRSWAETLIQEEKVREPGWELAAQGLVLVGLARLQRLHDFASERPRWLDDALRLARQQQSLQRIAAEVERHPSHLAREFRRHEGVSIGEYARRCRLELAARALATSEATLAQVAIDAGFCDQSHFTRAFQRIFGSTPAEYRRSIAGPR